jgi:hypothetical protein
LDEQDQFDCRDSIAHCEFVSNSGDVGAALYVRVSEGKSSESHLDPPEREHDRSVESTIIIENTFSENTGGTILDLHGAFGTPTEVRRNTFIENVASSAVAKSGIERSTWSFNRWINNTVSGTGAILSTGSARTAHSYISNLFVDNVFSGPTGDCVFAEGRFLDLSSNICVGTINGNGIHVADTTDGWNLITVSCNDSWSNSGYDFIYPHLDTTNVSEDPYFCHPDSLDYSIMDVSPCAPANNPCGVLIGADSVGCSGIPEVIAVTMPAELDIIHTVDHTPLLSWSFSDPIADTQTVFEIAVGTDDDWEYAEMWNPAPFESDDTSIVYAGAPLLDGETYYLRLRVHNAYAWSEWYEMSFRMKSVPAIPIQTSPGQQEVVSTLTPTLVIENSLDAEGDSLSYSFDLSPDSFQTTVYTFVKAEDSGDSTMLQMDSTLEENAQYWWRVKASDYYEESDYSETWTFFVDAENTAPSSFQLDHPPDTAGTPLITLTPEFIWSLSADPDPLDSVLYTLYIALDSNFTFQTQIPNLPSSSYIYEDSLAWGTRYWWKVKAVDTKSAETWSDNILSFRTVTLGDAGGDGVVNVTDVVFLVAYIFGGGPEPVPYMAGDADCNGVVNVSDAVYLITYIFGGGPPPCEA